MEVTIREQLARILASDSFVRSKRMQRFLEFVVEETLAGRADQVSEYVVGVAVFDRPEDFEPALDPIVRNDARRLRLKLFEYYRAAQAGEMRIEIPKGAYLPVFLPPVRGTPSVPRLAVLPFETSGSHPESSTIVHSLCSSITVGLTNLEGLETVGPAYLRDCSLRGLASDLRITYALVGSVMLSGDLSRVAVNLIRVQDGAQIWAREFDLDPAALSAIELQIVRDVVGGVTKSLLRSPANFKVLSFAA